MTQNELNTLGELLLKLQKERLDKYKSEGYDVDNMNIEDILDLDDGDGLLESISNVYWTVDNLKNEGKLV